MINTHKRLYSLIYRSDLSTSNQMNQIIHELKNCCGSIVLNENKKLTFINSSTIEDYLYHPSCIIHPCFGYKEAALKRDQDIQAVQSILNLLNECIKETDMLFFYENHILGNSYRKIYKKYGFSRTKCTAANKRILSQFQKKLSYHTDINRSGYEV